MPAEDLRLRRRSFLCGTDVSGPGLSLPCELRWRAPPARVPTAHSVRTLRRAPCSPAAVALVGSFIVRFVGLGTRFAVGLALKPIAGEPGWPRSALGLLVRTPMPMPADDSQRDQARSGP